MKDHIKKVIISIVILALLYFLFRTTELTITYDGVERNSRAVAVPEMAMSYKASGATNTALSVSNMLDSSAVYEEDVEELVTPERYRENIFYRVDTDRFDKLTDSLIGVISELNGVIKINEQNSNRKKEYDKEFYPRYQVLEFTIDNTIEDVSVIEDTLKNYGEIRISNTSKTSIEQEIQSNKDRLKEIEAARKALQESKDKDWIARQDSNYAKESERIKNEIEKAEKQSTYKTYTINIYESIKFRVNSIKYWYENNWELKNAISNALPEMVKLFAQLIPITVMLLVFIFAYTAISRKDRERIFKKKLENIEKLELESEKHIHFDVKM